MFEHDEVVLEAKHVTRRFPASGGRTLVANDDINLKFYKGKTLGLVGESGCGKSTFMRFLVSLDTPSEGEILYRGKDITKLKGEELRQNRQNIQMVFQDPTSSFNPKMKIRDRGTLDTALLLSISDTRLSRFPAGLPRPFSYQSQINYAVLTPKDKSFGLGSFPFARRY